MASLSLLRVTRTHLEGRRGDDDPEVRALLLHLERKGRRMRLDHAGLGIIWAWQRGRIVEVGCGEVEREERGRPVH